MAMTFFRILGDWLHTVAILMILHRLFVTKNAQGVSRKTQELCLLTSIFRYLDLFTTYYSPYNTLMKLFYILTTTACIYVLTDYSNHVISKTYRAHEDFVHHWKFILLPCVIMGLLTYVGNGTYFDIMEYLWCVSLYLEATACIPQIAMFRKYRQVESLTGGSFILLMGFYRGCYVLNYVVRAHTEQGYQIHWALRITSILQFLICTLGVFWPIPPTGTGTGIGEAEESSSHPPAPLLPQLLRFYREICSSWKTGAALSGTACLMLGSMFQGRESSFCEVCFILLLAMTFLFTGFVGQMYRTGDLTKRRDQISTALCCIILWSVLVGVPFAIIMLLVLACCMVVCFIREHMLTGKQHSEFTYDDDSTTRADSTVDPLLMTEMSSRSSSVREEGDSTGILVV